MIEEEEAPEVEVFDVAEMREVITPSYIVADKLRLTTKGFLDQGFEFPDVLTGVMLYFCGVTTKAGMPKKSILKHVEMGVDAYLEDEQEAKSMEGKGTE
jgi:hypothetical protein